MVRWRPAMMTAPQAWPDDLDRAPLEDEGAQASAHALRRPFLLEAPQLPQSRTGVLLVHGFSGTPFEVRPLGEALWRAGYTVYAPRLAGHGTTAQDLAASTFHDWRRTVSDAFDRLRTEVDRICVCGLSLGGLLTLDLARERGAEIAAIQVLAAPREARSVFDMHGRHAPRRVRHGRAAKHRWR